MEADGSSPSEPGITLLTSDNMSPNLGSVSVISQPVLRYSRIIHNDNSIEAPWILHHKHGSTISELMFQLDIRKLLFKHLAHYSSPQSTTCQHVRFVTAYNSQWCPSTVVCLDCQLCRNPRYLLDLFSRILPWVGCKVLFLDLVPKVSSAAILSKYYKVGAFDYFRL
jgi:hypothetical protein